MNAVGPGINKQERRKQERRLFERRHSTIGLAEALYNINLLVHLTADPKKILARVLSEAARALDAGSAMIFLLREGRWEASYTYNIPSELTHKYYSTEEVIHVAHAIEMAAPLLVRDTAADANVNSEFAARFGITSLLCCPLIARGESMGGIVFHWYSSSGPPDSGRIDFTVKLANSISLALDNAGDLEEIRLYEREYEILNNMNMLFQAADTPKEYYNIMTESLKQLFPNDRGLVYTVDESKSILETIAAWGDKKINMLRPGECWALRLKEVYSTGNILNKTFCTHRHQAPQASYICVPMTERNENIGLFHLEFDTIDCPAAKLKRAVEHKKNLAEMAASSVASALVNLKLREESRQESIDPLTILCNRRYLAEIFERELHRMSRKKGPVGVIMLDVDHIGRFSEVQGAEARDTLLGKLGVFVRRRVRAADIACRRGEGLVVILPEATRDDCMRRAEQFREEIKHFSFTYSGQLISHITISQGVVAFPDDGKTREELYRAAEAALQTAKSEGHDRVVTAGSRHGKIFKSQ